MRTRFSQRKTRYRNDEKDEKSPHCSSVRLDTETNSLKEELVDEMSLRIENEFFWKIFPTTDTKRRVTNLCEHTIPTEEEHQRNPINLQTQIRSSEPNQWHQNKTNGKH